MQEQKRKFFIFLKTHHTFFMGQTNKEKIEQLVKQDKTNYVKYLNRMNNSYRYSSKRFIPLLISGKRVLDVGCGSGILTEDLQNLGFNVDGIDINSRAIEICKSRGVKAYNLSLYEVTQKYDTIIFSSVLHEFSSYAEENAYTIDPIIEALAQANNILNYNGQIIIRDGIKAEHMNVKLKPKSVDVINMLDAYAVDAPMFEKDAYRLENGYVIADGSFLKEFCFTCTWGKESYHREVQEQYGILRVNEWKYCVKQCGFNIRTLILNSDDYAKYVTKFFEDDSSLKNLFEQSTIIIEAVKI